MQWKYTLSCAIIILGRHPSAAKYIIRRLLFEEKQHLGDCRLTGRFAQSQTSLPVLQSSIIRRKNNE